MRNVKFLVFILVIFTSFFNIVVALNVECPPDQYIYPNGSRLHLDVGIYSDYTENLMVSSDCGSLSTFQVGVESGVMENVGLSLGPFFRQSTTTNELCTVKVSRYREQGDFECSFKLTIYPGSCDDFTICEPNQLKCDGVNLMECDKYCGGFEIREKCSYKCGWKNGLTRCISYEEEKSEEMKNMVITLSVLLGIIGIIVLIVILKNKKNKPSKTPKLNKVKELKKEGFCKHCGAKITKDAKYCKSCGNKL